jgi:hypothetical protein
MDHEDGHGDSMHPQFASHLDLEGAADHHHDAPKVLFLSPILMSLSYQANHYCEFINSPMCA